MEAKEENIKKKTEEGRSAGELGEWLDGLYDCLLLCDKQKLTI